MSNEELREIFVDHVDPQTPDADEIRALEEAAGLDDAELAAHLDALRGRIEAEQAAASDAATPAAIAAASRSTRDAPPHILPLAAAFFLGVLGTLLVVFFATIDPTAPASGEATVAYLEPRAETDVLRGSDEEMPRRVAGDRLILLLVPPTAARLGAEPPAEVRFVLRHAASEEELFGGVLRLQEESYLVEVAAGRLAAGQYEIAIHRPDAGPDAAPLAVYELVVSSAPDAADAPR